jgi:hypothetical protein
VPRTEAAWRAASEHDHYGGVQDTEAMASTVQASSPSRLRCLRGSETSASVLSKSSKFPKFLKIAGVSCLASKFYEKAEMARRAPRVCGRTAGWCELERGARSANESACVVISACVACE